MILSSGRWGAIEISPFWSNLAGHCRIGVLLASSSPAPACDIKGIAPSPSEICRTSIWGTWDRLWPPSARNKKVTPFCTPEREQAAILHGTRAAAPQKQPWITHGRERSPRASPFFISPADRSHFIFRQCPQRNHSYNLKERKLNPDPCTRLGSSYYSSYHWDKGCRSHRTGPRPSLSSVQERGGDVPCKACPCLHG